MNYHRRVRRRLINTGVSYGDAAKVAAWFQSQVDHQGEDRALAYFKRVGDCILHFLYGSPQKPEWVCTLNGFPKGINCLRDYPEEVLLRVAKVARVILFKDIRKVQVEKVVHGVTMPYAGTPDGVKLMSQIINLGMSAVGARCTDIQPTNPRSIFSCFGRVTSVSGPTPKGPVPLSEAWDILNRVPELYNLPYWKEAFHPVASYELEHSFELYDGAEGSPVGEIHAAQEPGGKLRMFAAPYSIVQCLLRPIHDWIVEFRNLFGTDCTYDQEAGAIWAQQQLLEGKTVYSVDLTTATCRFPFVPQVEMLQGLGLNQVYIDALVWACKGSWVVGDELQPAFPDTLTWEVGQPLGLTPSMSMFGTAHNALLTGLCVLLGLPYNFRVLGDDVIMTDEDLYNAYTSVLHACGVPISWPKCHISDQFAEFAGFSISQSSMLRAGKWREVGINNHLSISADLGTPLYGEVPESWILIQKFHLYRLGVYTPTESEGQLFNQPSDDEEPVWPNAISALPHYVGVLRTVRSHGFQWNVLSETRRPLSVCLRGISLPGIDQVKALCWAVECNDIRRMVDTIHTHVLGQASRCLREGLITASEWSEVAEKLISNSRPLFWMPPKSLRTDGGAHHKSLAGLLGQLE